MREAQNHKTATTMSANVATKAWKELGVSKREAEKLCGVVTELLRRQESLEDTGSARSDPPPLNSCSDNSWEP